MDVLTSETCFAINKVIIKQVASSWCLFIQQSTVFMSSDFFLFSFLQMLIFSLGKVLQRAVKSTDLEGGNLEAVLQCMVHPNPAVRASLMDLFDVSTASVPLRPDRSLCL